MRAINTQHLDGGTNICSLEGSGWSEQAKAREKASITKEGNRMRRVKKELEFSKI